jgi:transglutaminase-like putative cysteine protease
MRQRASALPRMNPASSLRAGFCADADASNVRETVRKVTAPFHEQREKARAIFEFVRDEIAYNFAPVVKTRKDFRASHTLDMGNGFCMQKAALFTALCRAAGIPARIGFQDIADYKITSRFYELMKSNVLVHHGMNAVYLDGCWLRVDCTLDRGLVERKKYRLVEFDGSGEAILPETDQAGQPHFKILKQSGFYNDTPLFAINSMLYWTKKMPYQDWRRLVHGKGGSM